MCNYAGRAHYVIMIFCDCEMQSVTLLRWGFWPSTVEKPNVAYLLELMSLLDMLLLECQVSITSFIQMMAVEE